MCVCVCPIPTSPPPFLYSHASSSHSPMPHTIIHRDLLADDPGFLVPTVIAELSSKRVLTTQLIEGLPLDQCVDLPQPVKNDVREQLSAWGGGGGVATSSSGWYW